MKYIRPCTRIFRLLILLFAIMMLTSACAPKTIEIDTQASVEATPEPSDAPVTVTKEENEEKLPEPEEQASVRLVIGSLKQKGTLHPLFVNDEASENIMSLIYEPAIKLDQTDTPYASVIESWTRDADNGKEIIFNVRKNVFYHGTQQCVTAQDIIWCIEKIRESEPADCRYSAYKDCIKSVEPIDDYSFKVNLYQNTDDIFYLMSFYVIPQSVYAGLPKDTFATPIGTGGFKVVSHDVESGYILQPNDNWWRTKGDVAEVEIKFFENDKQISEAYRNGDINCVASTESSTQVYETNARSSVNYTTTQYYDALIPNCNVWPLNQTSMRKGISLALNRAEIISQCLNGKAVYANTPLRLDKWYTAGIEQLKDNDRQAAMQLFAQAGYEPDSQGWLNSNGVYAELKLIYNDSSKNNYKAAVAPMVAAQLEDIGIKVTVIPLNEEDFNNALSVGNFDLALCSFYVRANDDLNTMLGDSSTINYGGYTGESLQGLILDANSASEQESEQAFTALYEYLGDNCPHIGLYFKMHSLLLPKEIVNVGLFRARTVFTDLNTWKKE